MTRAELEHIQTVCHEWLRQPGVGQDSRRRISSSALSRPVELKITGLLTFDDVLITSAVDTETGSCYTKLIARPGEAGEFFDTPFEAIAADTDAPVKEPARVLTATRERYQEAMARLRDSSPGDVTDLANQIEIDSWSGLIPRSERDADDVDPKFLLYT